MRTYRAEPDAPHVCVWCAGQNETTLLLCPDCEDRAKQLRENAGLPVRESLLPSITGE